MAKEDQKREACVKKIMEQTEGVITGPATSLRLALEVAYSQGQIDGYQEAADTALEVLKKP